MADKQTLSNDQLRQLIAAGPQGSSGPSTSQAIGVPDKGPDGKPFQAQIMDEGPTGPLRLGTQAPRYFTGDEYTQLNTLDPQIVAGVQLQMANMGLITQNQSFSKGLGVVDNTTADAFKQVLAYANANGMEWTDALQAMSANHDLIKSQIGTPATPKNLPTYKLTNPTDLQATFKKAAQDVTGQAVDDGEVQKMVAAYNAKEQYAQSQAFNASGQADTTQPNPGGTVIAPPDPSNFAEQQIRAAHPLAAAGHDTLAGIDGLLGAFGLSKYATSSGAGAFAGAAAPTGGPNG